MSEDTGFEDAVAKYVVLRSEMRDMEEAHKAAMAELQAEQEEYTAIILATCNQLGADSLRTAAGTVTRQKAFCSSGIAAHGGAHHEAGRDLAHCV